MKNLLLLAAAGLALSGAGLHAQTTNLVLAIAQPPHASAQLTETQFESILAAGPALITGKTGANITSFTLVGSALVIRFAPTGGTTLDENVTLTADQLAAMVAAGPSLPAGETPAKVRYFGVVRLSTGLVINVQFSS